MAKSQNGWTAGSKSALGIVSPTVPGTNVALPQGVRGGDVETVLMYVARRFHGEVEPLRAGWCWGYHYKQIEGSSSLSNHASGTAIDLNAPLHPMGARNTFSATQRAAIRRILADCDGVIRWGGDYSSRPDEMHFEIVKGAADVARLAAKIRGGKNGSDDDMFAKHGDSGDRVKVLQYRLHNLGYPVGTVDGIYGDKTAAALKAAMATFGAQVDGRTYGPAEVMRLDILLVRHYGPSKPGPQGPAGPAGPAGPPGPQGAPGDVTATVEQTVTEIVRRLAEGGKA